MCDTNVKTDVFDHSVAFQSASAVTISKLDARGAMCVGRSRVAYGFIERDWIERVDRLECVARELVSGMAL